MSNDKIEEKHSSRPIDKTEKEKEKETEKEAKEKEEESKYANDNEKLLILKYFDIFEQRLVLIDAIIVLNYFLNVVINKSTIGTIVKLREILSRHDSKIEFCMFEEKGSLPDDDDGSKMKFNHLMIMS